MKKISNIASISAFALVAMAPQMAMAQATAYDLNQDTLINNAQTTANNAQSAANTAQNTANNAQTTATNAQTAATNAQNAANTAQTTANNAQADATTGIAKADNAQADATLALGNAANAQADATTGIAKADNAQADATLALGNAANAQADATTAIAKADNAQADATLALANDAAQDLRMDGIDATNATQDVAIGDLRNDTNVLRNDVNVLRTDVNVLRTDVGNLVAKDIAQDARMDGIDETVETLGNSAANALGGGAAYDVTTGQISAPSYTIQGSAYNNVGDAMGAINTTLNQHGARLDNLQQQQELYNRQASGGIAAAMALGGAMIVPDSTVSVNFNIATYRGEQGFAGNLTFRASERVYFNGGVVGSTVRGSTGGRVGVAFGF